MGIIKKPLLALRRKLGERKAWKDMNAKMVPQASELSARQMMSRRKFLKTLGKATAGAVAIGIIIKPVYDHFEMKARVKDAAIELKKMKLNPNAAESMAEFNLNGREAKAFQQIAAETFQRNADSLSADEFDRTIRALNISRNGDAGEREFREFIEKVMDYYSGQTRNIKGPDAERVERIIRAQKALLNNPEGLRLARKIWSHR
ncbi:MAG: twin-arginine translocation signal domain-containing protein [archaeon]